jgi:cell shape-determining protein MreC
VAEKAEIKVKVLKMKELQRQIEELQKDVNIVTRRVQATSTGTVLISLPRNWCEKHNIKKGSEITISQQSEYLIIVP